MTPQEALANIKRGKCIPYKKATITKIAELCEKQIPKKPKIRWDDGWGSWEYFCPVCNAEFDMSLYREYRQFCPRCGQKIDWSEENA